jgi:hypothetical protein
MNATEREFSGFRSPLTLHGAEYPSPHDLGELLLLSVERVPALEKYKDTLPAPTDFAVAGHCDDLLLPVPGGRRAQPRNRRTPSA